MKSLKKPKQDSKLPIVLAAIGLAVVLAVPTAVALKTDAAVTGVDLNCNWLPGSLIGDIWNAGCIFTVVVCGALAGAACPVE